MNRNQCIDRLNSNYIQFRQQVQIEREIFHIRCCLLLLKRSLQIDFVSFFCVRFFCCCFFVLLYVYIRLRCYRIRLHGLPSRFIYIISFSS